MNRLSQLRYNVQIAEIQVLKKLYSLCMTINVKYVVMNGLGALNVGIVILIL